MSHVDILKLHSLKATPQRLCVLDVLEEHGHVTLENIERFTKLKFPTLSLSTIYRNINEMLKKEILSEVKIANKKEYYEITKENHTHLICSKCGKIEDFIINTDDIIKNAQTSTCNKINNVTLSFDNICKECLSAK
jgi:Fur family peroxide stress response transcriptional regulator